MGPSVPKPGTSRTSGNSREPTLQPDVRTLKCQGQGTLHLETCRPPAHPGIISRSPSLAAGEQARAMTKSALSSLTPGTQAPGPGRVTRFAMSSTHVRPPGSLCHLLHEDLYHLVTRRDVCPPGRGEGEDDEGVRPAVQSAAKSGAGSSL